MNKKNLGLTGFLAIVALTASGAASAQQGTFDFTGTVTSSDLGWITAGTAVTGTYTFNFANADDTSDGLSDSNVNNGSPWYRQIDGGAIFPSSLELPMQTGSVFSSSVTVGTPNTATTTFANPGLSAIGNSSNIRGDVQFYSAGVTDYTSTSSYVSSGFSLTDYTAAPFGLTGALTGLPVLGANTTGTGSVEFVTILGSGSYNVQSFDYSITSLTAVSAPEINPASAASGLTLLLGGLAVLRGRRKVVANDSA